MNNKISATEAVRKFSEILSHVQYQGKSFIVIRGRKAVASISPVSRSPQARNLGELKSLLAAIPRLGAEAEAFEAEVRASREDQPDLPGET